MLRTPEEAAIFQLESHENRVEGKITSPALLVMHFFDAAQDAIGFLSW